MQGSCEIIIFIDLAAVLAAGIKVMIRSAQEIQQTKEAEEAAGKPPPGGSDVRVKDGD